MTKRKVIFTFKEKCVSNTIYINPLTLSYKMWKFLKPAAHKELLSIEKVDKRYKKLRFQVFLGIFIGYAGYYLVRKNFSIAMPALEKMGYDKSDLGWALSAVSIAYGLSKFVMGAISDRSNARVFITLGLILSAGVMIMMGFFLWATSSIMIMFILLLFNGWFQGMGWPPCGRVMVHWFSVKERGVKMSIWNVAHNVGGAFMAPLAVLGISIFGYWGASFYFPGMIALVIALLTYVLVRDTPQSCALPPIELYRHEEKKYSEDNEKELNTRQILFQNVLNNKILWVMAAANAFVYLVRYGVLDWAPLYLEQVKGMSLMGSSISYFIFEIAGIFGTILCGWISDKLFQGRRVPVIIIYMLLVMIAIYAYWQSPSEVLTNIAIAAIGFLIYGPVMLIGVSALDLVSKKAAGTAAGFTGFFGYVVGSALLANVGMGYVFKHYNWNGGFIVLMASCVVSIALVLLVWQKEKRKYLDLNGN